MVSGSLDWRIFNSWRPFKFYRNQPRRVTWKARVIREGSNLVAYASLELTLARHGRDPERMLHFAGKVLLSPVSDAREEKTGETIIWKGSEAIQSDEIYKLYFHGPSFQVLEAVVREGESVVGKLRCRSAADDEFEGTIIYPANPGRVVLADGRDLGNRDHRDHGAAAVNRQPESLPDRDERLSDLR